ncbi:MAG: hypothetical protein ACI4EW_05145 [Butyrivibrio sp.]
MKKIACILVLMIIFMVGCTKSKPEKVENSLSMIYDDEEIIEIVFVQGKGVMRDPVPCEDAEDISSVTKIFEKVSSDGEPDANYDKSGLWSLYEPSIELVKSSGEKIVIDWKIDEGILVCDDDEYYISNELAQDLCTIFTDYNPYSNNRI